MSVSSLSTPNNINLNGSSICLSNNPASYPVGILNCLNNSYTPALREVGGGGYSVIPIKYVYPNQATAPTIPTAITIQIPNNSHVYVLCNFVCVSNTGTFFVRYTLQSFYNAGGSIIDGVPITSLGGTAGTLTNIYLGTRVFTNGTVGNGNVGSVSFPLSANTTAIVGQSCTVSCTFTIIQ